VLTSSVLAFGATPIELPMALRVEREINLLPTTASMEGFADLAQCRPERGVGEHLEPSLRLREHPLCRHRGEPDTGQSKDSAVHDAPHHVVIERLPARTASPRARGRRT
jgi:hypothetical protein